MNKIIISILLAVLIIRPITLSAYTRIEEYNKAHAVPLIVNVGSVASQTFVSNSDNIQRLLIRVATYNKSISETFNFKIYEVNNPENIIIFENVRQDIVDNGYLYFDIPNSFEIREGEQFKFEIELLDDGDEEKIAYWVSDQDNYKDGIFSIDNNPMSDHDLTFHTQGESSIIKSVIEDIKINFINQITFFCFFYIGIAVLLILIVRSIYLINHLKSGK